MKRIISLSLLMLICGVTVSRAQNIEISKKDAVIINHMFDQHKQLLEISAMKDSIMQSLREVVDNKTLIIENQLEQLRKYDEMMMKNDTIISNHKKMAEIYEKSLKKERQKSAFWKYVGLLSSAVAITTFLIK
nr:MAG TPA: hypothetical protein [Caudoviricetes sp.]